jgi:hypothetical protein
MCSAKLRIHIQASAFIQGLDKRFRLGLITSTSQVFLQPVVSLRNLE